MRFPCRRQESESSVVIVCPMRYGPPWNEGVANLSRRLVRHFVSTGGDVSVLFPYVPGMETRPEASAGERLVPIRTVSNRLARSLFWVQVALVLLIRRKPRGVLLLASARPTLRLRVALLQLVAGGRVAVYIPGLASPKVVPGHSLKAKWVFVGSPFLQRYFPTSVCVPPLAAEQLAAAHGQRPETPSSEFRLLYLGAAEKARGLEYLLEGLVFASYLAYTPLSLRLALNGHGDYSGDTVREMIDCMGLTGSVILDGDVDLIEAYGWAHAVVIPRASEMRMAFPLRLIEALTMKRPLIVTDACDMDQLLQGAGIGVPRCDSLAVGRAIAALADDDELFETCVSACDSALQRIRALGSFDTIYEAMTDG